MGGGFHEACPGAYIAEGKKIPQEPHGVCGKNYYEKSIIP